jgi:hypothetical protein
MDDVAHRASVPDGEPLQRAGICINECSDNSRILWLTSRPLVVMLWPRLPTSVEGRLTADSGNGEVERRSFLARGGLVAGGAALGAALTMSPAGAQQAQTLDYVYFPIPPTRLYDSRQAAGPLFNGQTRTLVGNFNTLDPVPIAITVNLTVTLTRQKGWLALYPGDVTFSGTSSINWFGDFQDLANNAYVGINENSTLELTCGGIPGAQADFILDIIGATAQFDLSAASLSDTINAYSTPWREARVTRWRAAPQERAPAGETRGIAPWSSSEDGSKSIRTYEMRSWLSGPTSCVDRAVSRAASSTSSPLIRSSPDAPSCSSAGRRRPISTPTSPPCRRRPRPSPPRWPRPQCRSWSTT